MHLFECLEDCRGAIPVENGGTFDSLGICLNVWKIVEEPFQLGVVGPSMPYASVVCGGAIPARNGGTFDAFGTR